MTTTIPLTKSGKIPTVIKEQWEIVTMYGLQFVGEQKGHDIYVRRSGNTITEAYAVPRRNDK